MTAYRGSWENSNVRRIVWDGVTQGGTTKLNAGLFVDLWEERPRIWATVANFVVRITTAVHSGKQRERVM